jgi:hypothetical protein
MRNQVVVDFEPKLCWKREKVGHGGSSRMEMVELCGEELTMDERWNGVGMYR